MHLYDAVTPSNIPLTAKAVGGYVDGLYIWDQAGWARFPNAYKVRIAVFATTNDGEVLDIEKGNATPAEGPSWVKMRRFAGVDPTIYCNASTWPRVRAAFVGSGVTEPHYWIANWSSGPVIPDGAVAVQYAHDIAPGYDLSLTNGHWPIADPAPVPAPTPQPQGDNVVLHFVGINLDANGNGAVVLDGGTNSTPGITSSAVNVPFANFLAATAQGSDPQADGSYWVWDVHAQDRNGFALVTGTGGPPNGLAGAYVLATA